MLVEPMNISYTCTLFHLNSLIYIFFLLSRIFFSRETLVDMKSDELYHVSGKKNKS